MADGQLPELLDAAGDGDALDEAAEPDGGRITMSRASFAPETTGPPTQTGSPVARALAVVLLPLSRTTVFVTRTQVQVLPSAPCTVTSLPLTDWTIPRWNATVRIVPPRPRKLNWPSMPKRQ